MLDKVKGWLKSAPKKRQKITLLNKFLSLTVLGPAARLFLTITSVKYV